MNWKNTQERYGSLSIAMHWLMLALLAGVYACIELREFYPKGSDPREALKQWHFMLGLSVFMLLWVRLVVRMLGPVPRIEPPIGHWQQRFSVWMHLALYVFMLAQPLLGWLILSGEAKPIPFFGLELPALMAPSETRAESVEEIHETLGELGYYLIGLHTAAALFHHYIQHDNTLWRMLPFSGKAAGKR